VELPYEPLSAAGVEGHAWQWGVGGEGVVRARSSPGGAQQESSGAAGLVLSLAHLWSPTLASVRVQVQGCASASADGGRDGGGGGGGCASGAWRSLPIVGAVEAVRWGVPPLPPAPSAPEFGMPSYYPTRPMAALGSGSGGGGGGGGATIVARVVVGELSPATPYAFRARGLAWHAPGEKEEVAAVVGAPGSASQQQQQHLQQVNMRLQQLPLPPWSSALETVFTEPAVVPPPSLTLLPFSALPLPLPPGAKRSTAVAVQWTFPLALPSPAGNALAPPASSTAAAAPAFFPLAFALEKMRVGGGSSSGSGSLHQQQHQHQQQPRADESPGLAPSA